MKIREYLQVADMRAIGKNAFFLGFTFVLSETLDTFHYFETYPHIDIPFHFIGGFLVAQGLDLITVNRLKSKWILGGVGLIGIIWEISEILRGTLGSGMTWNTLQDLLMDMLGGVTYLMLRKKINIFSKFGTNSPS